MPSRNDIMLDSGCVTHVHQGGHGVGVKILSGPDAGKGFIGVVETAEDIVFDGDTGTEDRRAKRIVRFQDSATLPNIGSQAQVEIDGKKWTAVRNPGDGYLTTDYELKEIALNDK